MNMTSDYKPLCTCNGIDRRTPCDEAATSEDGKCDRCREHDCENSPEAAVFKEVAKRFGVR